MAPCAIQRKSALNKALPRRHRPPSTKSTASCFPVPHSEPLTGISPQTCHRQPQTLDPCHVQPLLSRGAILAQVGRSNGAKVENREPACLSLSLPR